MAMTLDELEALMDDDTEYLKFDRVEPKFHHRRDIHGMILLDKLAPGEGDIVVASEHDIIYYDADPEVVAANATPEDLTTLLRCGVSYNADDGFTSFT
jgi:hypothetical protein